MLTYKQSTGELFAPTGVTLGTGYAGRGIWKNDPLGQRIVMNGPVPQGFYTIEQLHDHPHLGPDVMMLNPDDANEMFGRRAFFIHGDSIQHPGQASDGCIVLDHAERMAVWNSGDRRLQVIP